MAQLMGKKLIAPETEVDDLECELRFSCYQILNVKCEWNNSSFDKTCYVTSLCVVV